MNNVKTIFSIKDLENLSGVKAHTIRIWERRYNILAPLRTNTNIRYYNVENLQKLLNITLLHKHGYKISKIATFTPEQIPALVKQIISRKSAGNHAINAFKIAMMNFDQTLFFKTYDETLRGKSFSEVFNEVFVPLLDEIGTLWQTDTITPAHEHFISYLIRQKILTNTEKILCDLPQQSDTVYVLFLPSGEVHELGLMYIHYEISLRGYRSVFLGENVPVDSLVDLRNHFDNITYISYLTVAVDPIERETYINNFKQKIMTASSKFWILGRNAQQYKSDEQITVFQNIEELIHSL